MRWPKIGELGEQIAMGLYLVIDYLPVCEDGQKSITGVVGECPPIAWKARRTRRVVGQYVRQQFPCHPTRVLRRISTGVPQRNLLVFLVTVPFWTNLLVRNYAWILLLRANGLVEVAEIARSTARVIVNRASMKTEHAAVTRLVDDMRARLTVSR